MPKQTYTACHSRSKEVPLLAVDSGPVNGVIIRGTLSFEI